MLLNYDGSGNTGGPERANISNYPLFSDETWCYVGDTRDFETNAMASFHTATYATNGRTVLMLTPIYERPHCRKHFAEECQTMMDHHDTCNMCRTCHRTPKRAI